MSAISARVLELLSLLQSRRHWSGTDLANRLEVSPRTLRRDVESLQDLGYPITSTRGTGGGYQLAPGGSLPPLVLNEDEAAAMVIALKNVPTGTHAAHADAAISALARIVQVLPGKIRERIDALQRLSTVPGHLGAPVPVDTSVLTLCALASRDQEEITFAYSDAKGNDTIRHVHPHNIVTLYQRLYLVAYDLDRNDWRVIRLDRVRDALRTGRTFRPRELPESDPAEFVRTKIGNIGARATVTATVDAPADEIRPQFGEWATVAERTDATCSVSIPSSDLDWTIFSLVSLDAPFTIHGPSEAIERARLWRRRLERAGLGGSPR